MDLTDYGDPQDRIDAAQMTHRLELLAIRQLEAETRTAPTDPAQLGPWMEFRAALCEAGFRAVTRGASW